MGIKTAIKVEQTGDRQVNQLQNAAAAATQQLRGGPFGDGVLVQNINVSYSSTVKVTTGLGRPHRGWVLVAARTTSTLLIGLNTAGNVVEVTDLNTDGTVTFYAYFTGNVDIWFY